MASGAAAERSALLRESLSCWRGEALAGLRGSWAERARATLNAMRDEALTEWADAELRLGNPTVVISPLREALLASPLVESFRERLIAALYLDGRTVDALQAFDATRVLLADELGVDPSRRLQRMHTAILRGDPLAPIEPPGADRRDGRLITAGMAG